MDIPVTFKVDLRPTIQRLVEAAFSTAYTTPIVPAPQAAEFVVSGGMVTVFAPTRQGSRRVAYGFNLGTALRGLTIMFTRYPAYIAGILSSQEPGPVVGHVFMQCCLYGEVLEQYDVSLMLPPVQVAVGNDDPEYALFFI